MGTSGDRGSDCAQQRRVFRQYALRGATSVHVLRLVEQGDAESGEPPAMQVISGGASDEVDGSMDVRVPSQGSSQPGRGAAHR